VFPLMKLGSSSSQKDVQKRLNLAVQWLLNSGIQNSTGAFSGWYDAEKREYPFIYGEMIGYGIQTFLYLYDREKEYEYLRRAERAADWLIKNMVYRGNDLLARGAFVWRYYLPNGPLSTLVYAFDNGICMSALVDLFQATYKEKYLNSAISTAEWLLDVMRNSDGSFKACYDFQAKTFGNGRWSKLPGSYHAKLSIGLLKLYSVTKNEKLVKSVRELCDWVLKLQKEDGGFKTNKMSNDIYVHAHCYAVEGLLYASKMLSEKRFEEAALKGCEWLQKVQKSNGAISRWYYGQEGPSADENTEALAQTVRLWLLSSLNNSNRDLIDNPLLNRLQKAVNRLLDMQCLKARDKRANGGFFYAILEGKLVPHINCWSTLFSIQALQMYLDWVAGNFSYEYFLKWLI